MTAPGLDERDHAAALKAVIEAQLGQWKVYEYGEVPGLGKNAGQQPPIYVLLQVERRSLAPAHSSRTASRTGWRASIRAVGRTASECRWATHRVSLALDSQRVTVDGHLSTPVQHETTDSPEPDGDRYESLIRWTYAL